MWTAVLAFLRINWVAILKWGLIALSVLAVLMGARRQGRLLERVEQREETLKAAREARRIEEEVRRLPDGGALEELRKEWSRD